MRYSSLVRATAPAATLALAVSVLGLFGSAPLAHADGTQVLPVTDYADIAVDGVHHHVFVSDPTGDSVVVTDYDGAVVAEIANEDGASGLALSADSGTLYVALRDSDAIAAVDTDSLTEQSRWSTGTATRPVYLAMTGGRLWFGYSGAETWQGGIASLDPSAPNPETAPGPGGWYTAPQLAASPAAPDTLVAANEGLSPATLAVYDADGATLTSRAEVWNPGGGTSDINDLAVTPDGKDVVTASGSPYVHQAFHLTDLSPDSRYTSDAYPNSVAIAADGTVAGGISGYYEPDVYVFRQGTQAAFRSYDFADDPGAGLLEKAGLAWAPDASRLFAVAGTANGLALKVLVDADRSQSSLTVSGPSVSRPRQDLTVTGQLASPEGDFPAGTKVTVVRTGPVAGSSTTLPDVTVAADGTFAFTDRPERTGTAAYTVTYAGDAHRTGAAAEVSVPIQR